MAHTLNADEQYSESLDYYQKAISLFENTGAAEQAARTKRHAGRRPAHRGFQARGKRRS